MHSGVLPPAYTAPPSPVVAHRQSNNSSGCRRRHAPQAPPPSVWASRCRDRRGVALRAESGTATAVPGGLHGAAERGETDRVRLLLQRGSDVLSRDRYSDTPLHKATVRGHTETAKLLLVSGADASAVNAYGWTPLHYACAAGAVDAARLLLVWGACVCACDGQGDSPLHLACYAGHSTTVALLLAWGADVDAVREGGITPLHWAASQGHAAVAAQLLERGASCRRADASGDGPLHAAARAGHTHVVAALVAGGAPLAAAGAQGDTPLHCASLAGSLPVVQALLLAAASPRQQASAVLLEARNHSGAQALHAAAGAASTHVVSALLRAGADSSAVDASGYTPLHCCAVARGSISIDDNTHGDNAAAAAAAAAAEVAEALLAAGSPADVPCSSGWTPLHLAAATGSASVATVLLAAGAAGGGSASVAWHPARVAAEMGHTALSAQLAAALGGYEAGATQVETSTAGSSNAWPTGNAGPASADSLTFTQVLSSQAALPALQSVLTQRAALVPAPSAEAMAGMMGALGPETAWHSTADSSDDAVDAPSGAVDAAAAAAAARGLADTQRMVRTPADVAQQLSERLTAVTAAITQPAHATTTPSAAALVALPSHSNDTAAMVVSSPAGGHSDASQVAFEAMALRLAGRVFSALGRGHSRDAYAAAFMVELRHAGVPHSAPFVAPVVYRNAVVATHTADVWLHPTSRAADGAAAAVVSGGTPGGVLALTAEQCAAEVGVPLQSLKALEACLAASPGVLSGGVLNFNPSGRLDARFLHRSHGETQ